MSIAYPPARRDDLVETLHGTPIPDPYRWLEDPDSEETRAWVRAQNAVSGAYLLGLPSASWFADTLRDIVLRPAVGPVYHASGWYFTWRNDGTRPQGVWYKARSLEELTAGGRVLFDPNAWSEDGSSSLGTFSVSGDGALVVYGRNDAGSDWQHFEVLDLETGEAVDDPGLVTKYAQPVWLPDHRSFVYQAFDTGTGATGTATTAVSHPRLKVHRVGESPDRDEEILHFPDDGELFLWPTVDHDRTVLLVHIRKGTASSGRLWIFPLDVADGRARVGEPIRAFDEPVQTVHAIGRVGDDVYVETDVDAPRRRVARFDLGDAGRGALSLHEVVPESEHTLESAVLSGDGLLVTRLADMTPRLTRYSLGGEVLGDLDVDAGAILALDAEPGREEILVTVSRVGVPSASYVADFPSGRIDPLTLQPDARPSPVPPTVTDRLRAVSRDGTAVPYFLIRPSSAAAGPLPTLVYGYGGFNIPVPASYSHRYAGWLAAGGQVAIANLRGGGEFGQAWYDAGRCEHKQNVFDDFAAVIEHLHATQRCSPSQTAILGGSNGGLLVGVTLTQRPELVGAAVPAVGVFDMLRYHKFTSGAAWKSDFGDPDVAADFAVVLRYSPLHNVKEGTAYPPTMVVTGDHDDRVVPSHSHKFTAALQQAQGGEAPIISRIETSVGHGMGKPLGKIADEVADILAFAAHHTGLVPPPRA